MVFNQWVLMVLGDGCGVLGGAGMEGGVNVCHCGSWWIFCSDCLMRCEGSGVWDLIVVYGRCFVIWCSCADGLEGLIVSRWAYSLRSVVSCMRCIEGTPRSALRAVGMALLYLDAFGEKI